MGAQHVIGDTRRRALIGGRLQPLRRVLLRRVWVPRAVYESVPALYLGTGAGALWSALYLPGWTWIVPYLALGGLGSLHAAFAVARLRYRSRRDRYPR